MPALHLHDAVVASDDLGDLEVGISLEPRDRKPDAGVVEVDRVGLHLEVESAIELDDLVIGFRILKAELNRNDQRILLCRRAVGLLTHDRRLNTVLRRALMGDKVSVIHRNRTRVCRLVCVCMPTCSLVYRRKIFNFMKGISHISNPL